MGGTPGALAAQPAELSEVHGAAAVDLRGRRVRGRGISERATNSEWGGEGEEEEETNE